MSEKIDYFFEVLDHELRMGNSPEESLNKAVSSYQVVYGILPDRKVSKDGFLDVLKKAWIELKK